MYENQIFRDIYDKYGNFDRVMLTNNSLEEVAGKEGGELPVPNNSIADQSTHEYPNRDMRTKEDN